MPRCRNCGKRFEEEERAKIPVEKLSKILIPSPRAGEG